MRTRWTRGLSVAGLFVAGLVVAPSGASGRPEAATPVAATDPTGLAVYTAELDAGALGALRAAGIDLHETPPAGGPAPVVEVVLSGAQADDLAAAGVDLEPQATSTAAAAATPTATASSVPTAATAASRPSSAGSRPTTPASPSW
jgi:hypothetical protein